MLTRLLSRITHHYQQWHERRERERQQRAVNEAIEAAENWHPQWRYEMRDTEFGQGKW
jgi:uncharacterized protein HemY